MTNIPSATYRLQFNPAFGFSAAESLVEYLCRLGISHIYASPIFAAQEGSTHGYDVTDPNEINAELGSLQQFERLLSLLKERGIGWIQDIVPNHMAFDSRNRMLMDVLEYGDASPFRDYFDIDWNEPYAGMQGKILAPFLGKFYGDCLESGEIRIVYAEHGFGVQYYALNFPLSIATYPALLSGSIDGLEKELGKEHPDFHRYLSLLASFQMPRSGNEAGVYREQIEFSKKGLWRLHASSPHIKSSIDDHLRIVNGKTGDPASFNMLDSLLSAQVFRLSFWKVATEEINYRRFFNLNHLIGVRIEDEQVFRSTHSFVVKMLWKGDFSGVRVDHIDGLYDPEQYMQRLRESSPESYLVVEKILQPDEELPDRWPVEGTTGYDFLNQVHGVFCARQNDKPFERVYFRFINRILQYDALVAEKKRLIMGRHMAGDIDRLARLLKNLSGKDRFARDITLHGLRRALVEIMAFFPVYRTYVNRRPIGDADRKVIDEAIKRAKTAAPALVLELEFIARFLLLEVSADVPLAAQKEWLNFVMKFQQLSGPLMAKGLEDTVFYIYNKLISLNEVGGSPHRFGTSLVEFHYFNKKRAARWPHTMNATSTHDSKRGEDARARLAVLSELPNQWKGKLATWHKWNKNKKGSKESGEIPEKNDEYFFYQALLAAYPFEERERSGFLDRMKNYAIKAVREAKVHTAWLKPDEAYENGFASFIENILTPSEDNKFLADFVLFQKTVAQYGVFNSISQTLLKLTCPGVPDFYQGSELWDFNLVDPDNRRPVNFELRKEYLAQIQNREKNDLPHFLNEMLLNSRDGRIKLYLVYRLLRVRAECRELFRDGTYLPLTARGKYRNHIIAFARNHEDLWSVTVAPRFLTSLMSDGDMPLGRRIWDDTSIDIPKGAPQMWTHALTGKKLRCNCRMDISSLCEEFPAAVLIGNTRQADMQNDPPAPRQDLEDSGPDRTQ
jgi:(1->4)-alpha-D-glucan 1-alpha-D-glucosylmutase